MYKKYICGWCMRGVWRGVGEVNTWRKIKSSRLLQLFPHPPIQQTPSLCDPSLSSGLSLPWWWRKVAPPILPSKHSQRRSVLSWKLHQRSHHFPCLPQTDNSLISHSISVLSSPKMREIVHLQAGQCGNQIGAKVRIRLFCLFGSFIRF